jgi:hypothetical protein
MRGVALVDPLSTNPIDGGRRIGLPVGVVGPFAPGAHQAVDVI